MTNGAGGSQGGIQDRQKTGRPAGKSVRKQEQRDWE